MAKTVGERSEQEARAFKARAWFRGMESMAYGTGEWRASDGSKLKMRHELREGRTQRYDYAQQSALYYGWSRVDSVALIGIYRDEQYSREIHDMLDMLQRQTQDIFDVYDDPKQQAFAGCDVPDAQLGTLRTQGEPNAWAQIIEDRLAALTFSNPNLD